MDFGQVKIAIGFDISLLQGMMNQLYIAGTIPSTLNFNGTSISLHQPLIQYRETVTEFFLALVVEGSYTTTTSSGQPLQVELELIPATRINGNSVVAGFRRGNTINISQSSLSVFIEAFLSLQFDPLLATIEIPIFDGIIQLLAAATGIPAPASTWSVAFHLGRPAELNRPIISFPRGQPANLFIEGNLRLTCAPCLVATIALPGESADLPSDTSFVPQHTGLQIMISRVCMDALLLQSATALIDTEVQGATITRFTMNMTDLGLYMDGQARKDNVNVQWRGVLPLFYQRYRKVSSRQHSAIKYAGRMDFLTSGLQISFDLPWYLALVQGLLFFMGPIGWIINDSLIEPLLEPLDDAPQQLRLSIGSQVSNAFNGLLGAIGFAENFRLFGHDAWIFNGHMAQTFIAFLGKNEHEITDIRYDSYRFMDHVGRSVGLLKLNSGHELHPNIAGRLMKDGILIILGHHGVNAPYGYYVRSNPNTAPEDNLVNRFDD